jgi:hypothetical protein
MLLLLLLLLLLLGNLALLLLDMRVLVAAGVLRSWVRSHTVRCCKAVHQPLGPSVQQHRVTP